MVERGLMLEMIRLDGVLGSFRDKRESKGGDLNFVIVWEMY